MPKVSVCVPTWNGERFIVQALESVLGQTLQDIELIVSDDCSVDNTLESLEQISDPRLRVVSNAERLGLVRNWNHCLNLATHEYVCVFHQDDVMHSENLARKATFLDAHPSVGMVFSNIESIDAADKTIGGHWSPDVLPKTDTIWTGGDFFQLLLVQGNVVACPTVVVRRSLMNRHGGFDARLRFTPDLEMWLRLSLYSDVGYLADPLVKIRQHTNQETNRFVGSGQEMIEVLSALQIVFSEHIARIEGASSLWSRAMFFMTHWALVTAKGNARCGHFLSGTKYAMLAARFFRMAYSPASSRSD